MFAQGYVCSPRGAYVRPGVRMLAQGCVCSPRGAYVRPGVRMFAQGYVCSPRGTYVRPGVRMFVAFFKCPVTFSWKYCSWNKGVKEVINQSIFLEPCANIQRKDGGFVQISIILNKGVSID
jgi:hypothetical protein